MGTQSRLDRYGLAFAVFVALACGSYFAASAQVPHPIPDLALRSPGIYRLEIGAAFFVASFLAAMVVLRALRDGPKGLRTDTSELPKIVDLDQIEDPVSRKEFEEMERLQRELEYFNRKAEAELRQAGLI